MVQKALFVCQQCGTDFSKWSGQCNSCSSWNSLTETKIRPLKANVRALVESSPLTKLSEVPNAKESLRCSTKLTELDRVLGGGVVPGMAILIGGDPGIGKSTLLSQVMGHMSLTSSALYISGEESLSQVSMRAQRLKLNSDDMYILSATCVEEMLQTLEKLQPNIVVIDSIQTIFSSALTSSAGSVSQVRECAALLIQFAKRHQIALFLVGHVTKDGALAGPRVLEHMVDTVLYFEGDQNSRYRLLRTVKNRFGPANELGVFAMTETGLQPVNNPSAIFLSQFVQGKPGSFITAIWEGSRPILVEVQSLVDTSYLGNPRRVSVGLDNNRVSMLLAILNRHAGINTSDQDVFVNIVGGIKVTETSADLGIALAIYSSLANISVKEKIIILGELGLSGEIRPVPNGIERLSEASKVGFEIALVPKKNIPNKPLSGLKVIGVETLVEAISIIKSL